VALPALNLFSPEEYLEYEERSQDRHEYYDGHIIAMAGASARHMQIATNLITALTNRFRELRRPCRAFASDARVYVDSSKYFYPDVSIFCGAVDMDEQSRMGNPQVVIEILSPSTVAFDRNEKAAAYRAMPDLKQLVLIDSGERGGVDYTRASDNSWIESNFSATARSIVIADVEITFDELYEFDE